MARATIFRHVAPHVISCRFRMLHRIDNFGCLIMAFSCDLGLFYCNNMNNLERALNCVEAN
jgi:hypothetical protein